MGLILGDNMQKFIMISGSASSGKTDAMLKIAAANSKLGGNNIIWNGETGHGAILHRLCHIEANMGNIMVVSPYLHNDVEITVCNIIRDLEHSEFTLYVDDPINVKCDLDGKVHIDPDSPLSLLALRAAMVYVIINVRRSGT